MQLSPLHEQSQATEINRTRGQAYGKAVRVVWAIASVNPSYLGTHSIKTSGGF